MGDALSVPFIVSWSFLLLNRAVKRINKSIYRQVKIEIYPVDSVIQPHSFLSAFKQPRPGLAVILIFINSNSSHCFKTTWGKSSHRILVTAICSGNESFSPFSVAIDWAAGCITYQRINSERSFSHLFACSVHSDNRARNSAGGGVKSHAWENERRLGRERGFPSPFPFQSPIVFFPRQFFAFALPSERQEQATHL